ncbi:acyl-CoA dehydrogenase family protein [bacterium]|nr:acyl-CoA dehydrogenase family protein [bacterium]MBU1882556.1 acyl-CoA dehydrogenase family protein [bacterium]
MDFRFTEEHEMVGELARKFAENEVRPLAMDIDRNADVPKELIDKISELGFMGIPFPEEYGGGDLGEIGYCILTEEIARVCLSTAATIGGHVSIGAMAVYLGGTEEQKQRLLPEMCMGEKLAAFALTEPQAGSDAGAISTTAVRKGDKYILNGQKTFITNGGIADVYSVFAVTNPGAGLRGVSAFLVDKNLPGFTAGSPEAKMGIRGSHTTDLFFEDVEVPAENLLGEENQGFPLAMKTLDVGRIGVGAQCLGGAKGVLELSKQHALQRVQFGKPIAKLQAIQWMLAEMATEVYNMENAVYRTAWMCDNNIPFSRQSAMTKLYCSEAFGRIVDHAVQIHGGMGYMSEYPIERFYRDARIMRIYEGTNEIQKLVIARDVLKQ